LHGGHESPAEAGPGGKVQHAQMSADGGRVVLLGGGGPGGDDCTVRDTATGRVLFAQPIDRQAGEPGVMPPALSGDGKRVAVGTASGGVKVFAVDTGAELGAVPAVADLGETVAAIVLDRTGERVAFGMQSDGRTRIKVCRADTGATERTLTLPGREGWFLAQLGFTPDGKYLVVSQASINELDNGSSVTLLDLSTGKPRRTVGPFPGSGPGGGFALSANGSWLAFPTGRNTVGVAQVPQIDRFGTASGTPDWPTLALSGDGRFLAAASWGGLITLHHLADGAIRPLPLRGNEAAVTALAFRGERVVSGAADGTLRQWDVLRPEFARLPGTSALLGGPVEAPAFDRAGARLANVVSERQRFGFLDQRVAYVWDTATGASRFRLELGVTARVGTTFSGVPGHIALSPDGGRLALLVNRPPEIDAVKAAAATLPGLGRIGGRPAVPRVLLEAGMRAIAPSSEGVRLFDVNTRTELATLPAPKDVRTFAFSPDGSSLLIAGDGWRTYDTRSGKLLASGESGPRPVTRAAFHPEGRWLAVAQSAGPAGAAKPDAPPPTLTLHDPSGEAAAVALDTGAGAGESFNQIAFDPTGNLLAVTREARAGAKWTTHVDAWRVGADGRAERAWSVELGGARDPGAGTPTPLAFSADGRLVAAAALTHWDRRDVRVWDAATGEVRHVLPALSGGVRFVGFTPDARRLLVAGHPEGTGADRVAELRVWDLTTGQELLEAPVGNLLAAFASEAAYHFDGERLRVAAWGDRGGELVTLDGSPLPVNQRTPPGAPPASDRPAR
jgi:WD40 repeat protein